MPNKPLLIQYANLKIQASKIEDEIDLIKQQVQAEVEALIGETDQHVNLQELPGFSFALAKARPKWQYSPTLQDVEADLKDMKKEEEQTGKATNLNEGKRELRFNQGKE